MFYIIVSIIFILSFLLALKSLRTLHENPKVSDVKKSMDKSKIIQTHSSSEGS